jgi:hypothetical protein
MGARRIGALLLAVTLATGLAACGGDDEDSGGVVLEDIGSSGSGSASGPEDEGGDTGNGGDGDSGSGSGDDAVDDAIAGAFSEGCGEFASVFGALGGAIAGAFDPEAAAEFEQFVDDAPEAIADDLETMAGAYEELAALFEDAGFDPNDPSAFDPSNPEALGVLTEAGELFSDPELTEASTNIQAFIADNCQT